MTHAEAAKIMASPPVLIQTLVWKSHYAWVEYQQVVGPGGLPERWLMREHTIHGTSTWGPAG